MDQLDEIEEYIDEYFWHILVVFLLLIGSELSGKVSGIIPF